MTLVKVAAELAGSDTESVLAAFQKAFEIRPLPMLKQKIDSLTESP